MKNTMVKSGLLAIVGVGLVAGTALATPVTFNGGSGDVDITTMWAYNPSGNLSLDAGLLVGASFPEFTLDGVGIGPDFTLNDGQSQEIDFFDLTLSGFGYGTYEIEASLDFISPVMSPANGQGHGLADTTIGTLSGGFLYWDVQPALITLADGNILSVSFEQGIFFGMGGSEIVHATVTNLGGGNDMNPVPEPATMLLFGTGLAGLASFKRRKMKK